MQIVRTPWAAAAALLLMVLFGAAPVGANAAGRELVPLGSAAGAGWVHSDDAAGSVYANTELHLAGAEPNEDYVVYRLVDSGGGTDPCVGFFANWMLSLGTLHTNAAGNATLHTSLDAALVPAWMHGIEVADIVVLMHDGAPAYRTDCLSFVMR